MNVRNHSQSLERLISPHSYSTHCSIFHRPSPDNHRLNVRTSDRCLPSSLHLPAVQILTKRNARTRQDGGQAVLKLTAPRELRLRASYHRPLTSKAFRVV